MLTGTVASVVAKVPVPLPVTSPVSVMVWLPVLVPERFDPVTVPEAATDEGVIAPSVRVIAGVVVAVATEPLTPLAGATETLVTVPLLPAEPLAAEVKRPCASTVMLAFV